MAVSLGAGWDRALAAHVCMEAQVPHKATTPTAPVGRQQLTVLQRRHECKKRMMQQLQQTWQGQWQTQSCSKQWKHQQQLQHLKLSRQLLQLKTCWPVAKQVRRLRGYM